jgi:hypothetical protein
MLVKKYFACEEKPVHFRLIKNLAGGDADNSASPRNPFSVFRLK